MGMRFKPGQEAYMIMVQPNDLAHFFFEHAVISDAAAAVTDLDELFVEFKSVLPVVCLLIGMLHMQSLSRLGLKFLLARCTG